MAKSKEASVKGIKADKDEFGDWFGELMVKADLADYTDVSGCMVFKPRSWAMWEKIQQLCDERFKNIGIQNVYFPMFIPEKHLLKEADHVEGFAPEVAWVEKTGEKKLSERLAIRPTSEAIMYPSFSKWIRSYRDLPLKYNQWVNVVRWEFNHPVPFMRTREFVFNEIHTVHATEKNAIAEGADILSAYKDVCENYMALYSVMGRKTDKEKFAGAVYTDKLHHVMPNGRAIEGAAFHFDGQNFAKAYDITFLNEKEKKEFAWQNTAAISTRMLGVMYAVHSDEKGLILPPKMTAQKAVIIPILLKGEEKNVLAATKKVEGILTSCGAFVDDRTDKRPGDKFNEWELKGIPLRIEIGPKDVAKKQVVVVRRDTGKKEMVLVKDLAKKIPVMLEDIHKNLFKKSKKMWEERVTSCNTLAALSQAITDKKIGVAPLCTGNTIEDELKAKTGGAKVLFVSKEKVPKGASCVISKKPAEYMGYVAKTY